MNTVKLAEFMGYFGLVSITKEEVEEAETRLREIEGVPSVELSLEGKEALAQEARRLSFVAERGALKDYLLGNELSEYGKGYRGVNGGMVFHRLDVLKVEAQRIQFGYGQNDPLFLAEYLIVGGPKPLKARVYSELRNMYMIIGPVEMDFFEVKFTTDAMEYVFGYLGMPPKGATLGQVENAVLGALHEGGCYKNGRYDTDSAESLRIQQGGYQKMLRVMNTWMP